MFRVVALILFAVAAGCAFGWWFHATLSTVVGLVAAGLFFQAAALYDPSPSIPLRSPRGGE